MKYQDWKAEKRAESAARTLSHYAQTVFEKNGLKWDADNEAEILDAVDDIVTATVLEVTARLREHA